MNLNETITYLMLKGVFLCRNVFMQTAHVWCLCGRADIDSDVSRIVPHEVQAGITMAGDGAGDRRRRAGAHC